MMCPAPHQLSDEIRKKPTKIKVTRVKQNFDMCEDQKKKNYNQRTKLAILYFLIEKNVI